MTCTSCGHENRPGRKFCVECGEALALACAACSAPYESGEKFCGECGAALGAPGARASGEIEKDAKAPDAGARKVVTIVFADLVGSTALHERLDAESARRVMERYYEALRAAVDAHGGTVVKLLGDGVMAAFGLKRVAEDDALRAVRAAAAMQEAFRVLVRTEAALGTAGLRVAVNTGEVVVSGARDDVIGDPVNVAARLQEQASDGDVVLGDATRRLVATRVTLAPLGTVTLKGRAGTVAVYRLESLEPPAGAAAAPFVGRDGELARLESAYDAAIAKPATRLAVLLGSPGLGKSRLIDELRSRHAHGATILAAHCDAAGGATFAPLAQVLRSFLGVEDGAGTEAVCAAAVAALPAGDGGERTRIGGGIAGLLGGTATSPEETFFVVRRFLAGLAAARPVVLVIDDLHWAEPLLLDLVEHLVQWGAGVPLFVLVGARPELRDVRSTLTTPGGVVGDVVTLGGLDAGAAMRLAANVIGAADLPAAVAAKVLATSEGNPLFVGELVRMLVQEGALTRDGDRWIVGANLAALEMPPTIHALLAARIERLASDDRLVLERASVVGRHFSRSAVAALLGRDGSTLDAREASELDARLESLRRSELIERDTGWLLGEPVMRFHHVLIRDAAYRRLLKGTRAELHGRLADWIEGEVGDAPEHDEIVGWHLEQAHQHLRELGALDAAGAALGERAARRLSAAGRRALARDDVSLAAGLCGRAIDRLVPDAPERADLVLDWCEALLAAGDVGPAADAIAELDRVADDASEGLARESARLRAWHTCFAGQLTVLTAPEALHTTADRVGAAARELAALEDAAGEAKAHFVHAQALARLGKIGASEAALDQALAAARRAGDRRRANAVLAGAPLAALWGPSPVTRASGRCLDVVRVLRITQGAPAVEAVALSCQGVLEALRGRSEAARRMLASSRTMVEELGISHRLFETDVFAGRIDLLEGDAPAAERALRVGYDGLRDLGLGIDAARAAALLGRALLAQDRAAEAETLSHESELLAGDDLQAAIAWRGVRAEALARRGDHAAAIGFAEAAVAIAAATDALLDHADARLALAAALHAAGRTHEADGEERRAIDLWQAKGATVLAERARRAAGPSQSIPETVPSEPAPRPAVRRHVSPNAATVMTEAFDVAFAQGNAAAFAALHDPAVLVIDHPTGSSYGREGAVESYERLLRTKEPRLHHEPLATLGDALGLFRRRIVSGGGRGKRFDVGAFDREEIVVVDAGALIEIFAADHLGDAVARLYQRYRDSRPPGPERERAAVMARAVSFILTPGEAPELSLLYAPTYVDVDHRTVGYGTLAREDSEKLLRSLQGIADDIRFRIDDVLALEPHGFVRKTTSSGVWREGGGAFERTLCTLNVFGPDGRVTHHETFDADREVEALARFDALTAGARPKPDVQRRVRPNAVTRGSAEFEAIVTTRNFASLATFFTEDAVCVDHPTGATYGAEGMRKGVRRLMQSPDARLRFIPLATLGETWGLVRREMSASGVVGGRFDVGAYEIVDVAIYGTDAHGRMRHVEIFAAERLGNAVTRLYECWADSLPEGPARTRAYGCARAVASFAGLLAADRMATSHAPAFECIDRRTLGTWSARGLDEWLAHWRGQADLADGFTVRADDVLALVPAAVVFRSTYFGNSRASGGYFENVVLALNLFDADGRITRSEIFEPDQEADALARFDELTVAATPLVDRRVRANAATRTSDRLWAAIARRDAEAFGRELADDFELVHHPTAASYGRRGMLATWRSLFKAKHFAYDPVVLGTLGDALVLHRHTLSADGFVEERLAVAGRVEMDEVVVDEVDADGRFQHMELFTGERLGDAIACAYARHAERLPAGPGRERAAMTARAAAAMLTRSTKDRLEDVSTPDIAVVDHRSAGMGTVTGSDLWTRWPTCRVEDVLALSPDGLLRRTTEAGTVGASGGSCENSIWILSIFGPDGRQSRIELFDVGREADALGRFQELAAAPVVAARPGARRLRANAASALAIRFADAFAAGDTDAVTALWTDELEVVDHPNAASYGREGHLASIRRLQRAHAPQLTFELLASLGDTLCLTRRRIATQGIVGGRFDVGASEHDALVLFEVDTSGRCRRVEIFAAGHLDDASIRLYDRYAEQLPDGRVRARAVAAARASATMVAAAAAGDPDRFIAALAPAVEIVDHRSLGLPPARGAAEALALLRSMFDLAAVTIRIEDLLALEADGLLWRVTVAGTDRASDAIFEMSALVLWIFDADGLLVRYEAFDVDHEAEALVRYDALVGSAGEPTPTPAALPFTNAASATAAPATAAIVAQDWGRFAALFADDFRMSDRRRGVQLELDRDQYVAFTRKVARWGAGRADSELLATRGERLALTRLVSEHSGGDVGPRAIAFLNLTEVDERGRIIAYVRWDLDDLTAAHAELDARYDAGEGGDYGRVVSSGTYARAYAQRDWDAVAAMCTPTFAEHDHRAVALLGTRHGPQAWAETERALVELAPDSVVRFNHVRSNARGAISQLTFYGADGGYEIPLLSVTELGAGGKLARNDLYDPEQLDEAMARFEAIKTDSPPATSCSAVLKPAAVIAAVGRWQTAFEMGAVTGDWDPMRAICSPTMVWDDRRRFAQISGDRELFIASLRERVAIGARFHRRVLGTAGDRVGIFDVLFSGGPPDGPFEIEFLCVFEVDEAGLLTAMVCFDLDDRQPVLREAWARWGAIEPVVTPWATLLGALNDAGITGSGNWRDRLAADLVVEDHRRTGFGRIDGGEAYAASVAALWELAPDQRLELGWSWYAVDRHAAVVSVRREGTLPEGGAFESDYVALFALTDGRVTRLEFFEVDALDRALARFEELRA